MKPRIKIRLFGKFALHFGNRELLTRVPRKTKELFAYLAVNHQKPIPRESLSTLLWGESPPERSQKSLRQAFWQLRRALSGPGERTGAARILRIDPGWAQLVTDDQVRLDVVEF